MKFEIVDNRELDLAGKGYKWAGSLREVDLKVLNDIRHTRGENYVDCLSDDFFDGYSPICLGDDGELYSVLFDFGGDSPRPVYWSKVSSVGIAARSDIKRVRKCVEFRAVFCVETRNMCLGRAVYEDLESGDLAVIINVPSGEVLLDRDTFLKFHRFFEKVEALE